MACLACVTTVLLALYLPGSGGTRGRCMPCSFAANSSYPHAASSRSGYTSRVNSAPLTGPPLCCRAQVMSVGRRGVGPLHRRPLADVSVGCDPCPHTGLALVCGGGVDSSGPPRGREREELGDQGSPAQSAGGPGPCAGAQRPSPPTCTLPQIRQSHG